MLLGNAFEGLGKRSMASKTRLLIVGETYEPGWKAGGPVQSLRNLVHLVRDSSQVYVFTRNHDHLDEKPFDGIPSNVWIEREGVMLYYVDDEALSYATLRQVYSDVAPDTLYLASVMSGITRRLLAMRRTRAIRPARIVVAPQGEMSKAARSNKPFRKWIYLRLADFSRVFSPVTWHASAPHEADDIRTAIRHTSRIYTIPDVAKQPLESSPVASKEPGTVTFVSVARISPIKNVLWLVRLFEKVDGEISLRLVGPHEPNYWREVAEAIDLLPPNVTVEYLGPVHPSRVSELLIGSDFFILPTLGEAFGHAIYESLRVGRPVLISNRTPWSQAGLSGAGWVMDPTDSTAWATAIAACVSMNSDSYLQMSRNALYLAQEWYASQDYEERYRELLGL